MGELLQQVVDGDGDASFPLEDVVTLASECWATFRTSLRSLQSETIPDEGIQIYGAVSDSFVMWRML